MKYKCGSCGETYRTIKLKRECEKRPIIKTRLPMGSVFKFDFGVDIYGILYDEDHVQKQTHMTLYKTANTGLCLTNDKTWSVLPENVFEAPILDKAIPITNEEFEKVKEALTHALNQISKPKWDADKLRRLKLKQYTV